MWSQAIGVQELAGPSAKRCATNRQASTSYPGSSAPPRLNRPAFPSWTSMATDAARQIGSMGRGEHDHNHDQFESELRSQTSRNRRVFIEQLHEMERQWDARREASEQLQVLIESSPATITWSNAATIRATNTCVSNGTTTRIHNLFTARWAKVKTGQGASLMVLATRLLRKYEEECPS